MADQLTEPLRAAIAWVPCDDTTDDDQIAKAIERWHVEHDLVSPADQQFADATWEKPAGTVMSRWPDAVLAPQLRVTMPNRNRYVLEIDWDGACGCPECRGGPSYIVRNARIADVRPFLPWRHGPERDSGGLPGGGS